jgi:putative solute:sodium symporter small subunit
MESNPQLKDVETDAYRVNFFHPRPGFMRQKVRYTWFLLAGWALFTFGFQCLLLLTQENAIGEGPFTRFELFRFPLHLWFSGQFLIFWFILQCFLFNTFVDRLTRFYRKRN